MERACSTINLNATTIFFSFRWSEGALRFCDRERKNVYVGAAHTHSLILFNYKYANGSVSAYGFLFSTIKHIHAYIYFSIKCMRFARFFFLQKKQPLSVWRSMVQHHTWIVKYVTIFLARFLFHFEFFSQYLPSIVIVVVVHRFLLTLFFISFHSIWSHWHVCTMTRYEIW